MNRLCGGWLLGALAVTALMVVAGCAGSPAPLDDPNVNLIFVASEDLSYNAVGDVNPNTANLTNIGLQRALLMGTFLKERVVGNEPLVGIYALEPMTHLQTANQYPDIVALETVEQFAMLNQFTIAQQGYPTTTANSYPIFASYAANSVPAGVASPPFPCTVCQGLDFTDENEDNEALITSILATKAPGNYVFSAPWETVSALMASANRIGNYRVSVPEHYAGPNVVYVISVTPSGLAALLTYNGQLHPAPSYPVLPPLAGVSQACPAATINIQVTDGVGGATVPAGINTNETAYMIRHAEAHPSASWDDGNYIGAGQWRALYLPQALSGKISPSAVYSIDPANDVPEAIDDAVPSSYVRPTLTAEPYAIANNLPFFLAASVPVFQSNQNPPNLATAAAGYFFFSNQGGPGLSGKTTLIAWEHDHIPPTVEALIHDYGVTPPTLSWSDGDYDSIWTIRLDAHGNLSVDNALCEGVNSSLLPATPPQF